MFKNKTFLVIFGLGFSSGLPFLLLVSTLSAWLVESGVSKTAIGMFSLATLPYAFKFCWAPWVDSAPIPFLNKRLGQRRGWLLFSQMSLLLSLLGLGSNDPKNHVVLMGLFALLVGFCSATQDIIVEAYRIEALSHKQIGYGASSSVLGYRFGMLFSGAGALFIADYSCSWFVAYTVMAFAVLIGMLATWMADEPKQTKYKNTQQHNLKVRYGLDGVAKKAFEAFFKQEHWWVMFLFILLYKVGDTVLNAMSMPFLIELGFSKTEIAQVSKTFGISAMILGVMLGGGMLMRYSLSKNLYACLFLQVLASGLFIIQAQIGYHVGFLYFTMGIENLACGLSQVSLIAYFSKICSKPYTGTHYAILSSFSSLSRIGLTVVAGVLADKLLWVDFYTMVCLGCIPAILLLWRSKKHFENVRFSQAI